VLIAQLSMAAGHYLELSWSPIAVLGAKWALVGRRHTVSRPLVTARVNCPIPGGLSYPRDHVLPRFDKWSCGMKARALIDGASFGPETVEAIRQAFDEAWVRIAPVSAMFLVRVKQRGRGSPKRSCGSRLRATQTLRL